MSYKLTYFDITGAGEPIRFLLSYGKFKFIDNRLSFEEFQKIKPDLPFGQLPILEVDGKKMNQSLAICRYLARKVNVAGKNEEEDYEINAIVDSFSDFRSKVSPFIMEQDPEKKEALKETLFKEVIPYFFGKFDEIVKRNGGYFALGRLTWADIYFVACFGFTGDILKKDIVADYSNLEALREKISNLPGIKEWIKKRPNNDLKAMSTLHDSVNKKK